MTIDDLSNCSHVYLTPADVAPILRCDPQAIRTQAHIDPTKLGYPVIVTGHRVRIPRIPFLRYLGLLGGADNAT